MASGRTDAAQAVKTSDITDSLLDQWTARALGLDTLPLEPGNWCWVYVKNGAAKEAFRPSQDWVRGGPIIEIMKIELLRDGDGWCAQIGSSRGAIGKADTCLVAAMRSLVREKFGDELPERE